MRRLRLAGLVSALLCAGPLAMLRFCRRFGGGRRTMPPTVAVKVTANSIVERLQGAILREQWRVEFRRRYFPQLTSNSSTMTVSPLAWSASA